MKRVLLLFPVAIVAALAAQWLAVTVSAHHSEAPFYDGDKVVEIKGTVTSWIFRNPHPFLHVEVVDEKGAKNDWVLEFVGPVRLIKQGWSVKTFTPGEVVSAVGHPSRQAGTFGLSPLRVSRADGQVIPGSGRSGGFTPEAAAGGGRGN
jgi:hypothetical protein